MNVWQEDVFLRFATIDCSDRLTLGAAVGLCQDAATSHAEILNVGRDSMYKSGQAWILSRFSVFIEKRPLYRTNISLKSWPSGIEKLFALRDFLIEDESGNAMLRGRSSWLVIDVNKRRPIRIESMSDMLLINEGLGVFNSSPSALAVRDNLSISGERIAAYSDIDYYGHVNNVRYVQWLLDICPHDLLCKTNQIRFDINFLNETLPGEKVELYSVNIDPSNYIPDNASTEQKKDYPVKPVAGFAFEGRKSGSPAGQAVYRAELRLGD